MLRLSGTNNSKSVPAGGASVVWKGGAAKIYRGASRGKKMWQPRLLQWDIFGGQRKRGGNYLPILSESVRRKDVPSFRSVGYLHRGWDYKQYQIGGSRKE